MNFPKIMDNVNFIHLQNYSVYNSAEQCLQSELVAHNLNCEKTSKIFEKVYNDISKQLPKEILTIKKYFLFIDSAIMFNEK